jgi:hypothetical protein
MKVNGPNKHRSNAEILNDCFKIEEMVRKGVIRNKSIEIIIREVEVKFKPKTNHEKEMFVETILYTKFGVLN